MMFPESLFTSEMALRGLARGGGSSMGEPSGFALNLNATTMLPIETRSRPYSAAVLW